MTPYIYKVELVRVVDGDTYDFHVDVGFHSRYSARFRLQGFDTPELRRGSEYEKEKGREARDLALELMASVPELHIRSYKSDSFGRWLCDVFWTNSMGAPVSLGEQLLQRELATRWPKRWRDAYDAVT